MALGARVAAPERPVVALCGDGGFLLNVSELATAVQEKIDIVIVVFNDATYTAVKNDQYQHFNRRYIATDLLAPTTLPWRVPSGLMACTQTARMLCEMPSAQPYTVPARR